MTTIAESSRQPFLRAIAARPDDPLLPMIYADYLDENGECSGSQRYRWLGEYLVWKSWNHPSALFDRVGHGYWAGWMSGWVPRASVFDLRRPWLVPDAVWREVKAYRTDTIEVDSDGSERAVKWLTSFRDALAALGDAWIAARAAGWEGI